MKRTLTRIVSLLMALVLCLTAIPFSGMTAFAASGNIKSLPTTIKSYPVSTGNNTPGYTYKGGSKTGTAYANDLCTIKTIHGDGYITVTYPITGGTRTLYFKSNAFFNGTTFKTASITKYATAYRRSSGSATIGYVDSADKLVYVIGNAVKGRYQIVYRVTGTNYYKLGWVTTSAVRFDTTSTTNNTSSSNRVKLLNTAKSQIGYQGTNSKGYGSGDYCKYGTFTGTNGQPWCAAFVAWCANQAGISTAVVPKNAACRYMASGSNSYVKWSSNALSKMEPGDVVFFATNSINGTKRHVGIVSSISGNKVTVIEGNTSADRVEYKTYTVNTSGYINQNWPYNGVKCPMYFAGYINV